MVKKNNEWQPAERLVDSIEMPYFSGKTEFLKDTGVLINYFDYESILLITGMYGCWLFKYDKDENKLTFEDNGSCSLNNYRILGITKEHNLLVSKGGVEVYLFLYKECSILRLYTAGTAEDWSDEWCNRHEYFTYNHISETIGIFNFNSLILG